MRLNWRAYLASRLSGLPERRSSQRAVQPQNRLPRTAGSMRMLNEIDSAKTPPFFYLDAERGIRYGCQGIVLPPYAPQAYLFDR